jgi:hypothetical protein
MTEVRAVGAAESVGSGRVKIMALRLAAALFGEIPIHGRLPVAIPGLAQLGIGLDRDSVAARFGPARN